jgi:hypothetical protein
MRRPRPVNKNLSSPSTQASIRILGEPIGAGSMQDKFRVEAWRCHLSHELEAHSPRRSRQEIRVCSTPPSQTKIHTILGKGLNVSPVIHIR